MNGASDAVLEPRRVDAHEQRPAEHHQPADRARARAVEHDRRPRPVESADGPRVRRRCSRRTAARVAALDVARRSATAGPSTFATWGANAGDAAEYVGRRAVRDDLTLGHHDDPVGDVGDELHVVGARPPPPAARPPARRRIVAKRGLRGVVEAAGRLVEQQHRRRGAELDRQHQGEPLPLGQVTRVPVAGDARRDAGPAERPRSPAASADLAVGRRCTRRPPSRDRAGRSRSAAPAPTSGAASLRRDHRCGSSAGHLHPTRRCARPGRPGPPTAGTTCRTRCAPSAPRPSPGCRSQVDAADRDRGAVRHDDAVGARPAPALGGRGVSSARACGPRAARAAVRPHGGRRGPTAGAGPSRPAGRARRPAGRSGCRAASRPADRSRTRAVTRDVRSAVSAYCTTRSIRCSATRTVTPRSCTSRAWRRARPRRRSGRAPRSARRARAPAGCAVSTDPIATRCCWPPESVRSGRRRSSAMPSRSSVSSTRRRITSGRTPSCSMP